MKNKDGSQLPLVPAVPPVIDEGALRGRRIKALLGMRLVGDLAAEREVVSLLAASIEHAGDKQPDRAAWLGLSARYLRHMLSDEVGLSRAYPEIHGRVQGSHGEQPNKRKKR